MQGNLALGKNKPGVQDRLDSTWLGSSTVKRDLRVMVNTVLDMGEQRAISAKKSNMMLSCIQKGIVSTEKEKNFQLSPVSVRPHLKYCVQI